MWPRELLLRLSEELPRWRWKSRLTHRGGTVDGTTQKQRLQLNIKHTRGKWSLKATGLVGTKRPQIDLDIEGTFGNLEDLLKAVLDECIA